MAETLKLRGLSREVGVPRPCFGAVAPQKQNEWLANGQNGFSLRRPSPEGAEHSGDHTAARGICPLVLCARARISPGRSKRPVQGTALETMMWSLSPPKRRMGARLFNPLAYGLPEESIECYLVNLVMRYTASTASRTHGSLATSSGSIRSNCSGSLGRRRNSDCSYTATPLRHTPSAPTASARKRQQLMPRFMTEHRRVQCARSPFERGPGQGAVGQFNARAVRLEEDRRQLPLHQPPHPRLRRHPSLRHQLGQRSGLSQAGDERRDLGEGCEGIVDLCTQQQRTSVRVWSFTSGE